MKRNSLVAVIALAGLFLGCGGGVPTANPGPPPPHGGNLIPLRDDQGFVEVVKKEGASNEASIKGEYSFYFLKTTTTPFSSPPSTGTLRYGKDKVVTLIAEGGGLTTPPAPPLFKGGELDGVLSFDLNGKSMLVPLGIR